MPSSHLISSRLLLLLPPVPPSIRVFPNESALRIRWPRYWSFSFSISPSNDYSGLISFRTDWLDLLPVQGLLRVFSNTTVQKHQFFSAQPSSQSSSHIHTFISLSITKSRFSELLKHKYSSFIFLGSKITADGDCSHEIKRHSLEEKL